MKLSVLALRLPVMALLLKIKTNNDLAGLNGEHLIMVPEHPSMEPKFTEVDEIEGYVYCGDPIDDKLLVPMDHAVLTADDVEIVGGVHLRWHCAEGSDALRLGFSTGHHNGVIVQDVSQVYRAVDGDIMQIKMSKVRKA